MYKYRIYEYNEDGESTIKRWLRNENITQRDRGQLTQKMDMLATMGLEAPQLAGPISSKRNRKMQSHIYKLIVHGQRMLRPMLCKGPIKMDEEFTFLIGALEKGNILDRDAEEAETRRKEVVADPQRKRMLNGRYS